MTLAIVADENLAITPWLESLGADIVRMPGREIAPGDAEAADVLLVRSVTNLGPELLENSAVRFVGSATAGVDHIDTDYLARRGIGFASAPGANANAVLDYVLSAIAATGVLGGLLGGGRLGVVGYGYVGSRIATTLSALGAQVSVWDPWVDIPSHLRADSLDEILNCEVISLHAALHTKAPWPSKDLFDDGAVADMRKNGLLINAGRGGLISASALWKLRERGWQLMLDTWPEEPHIDGELLAATKFATPHIAGYSTEAKYRATDMLVRAMLDFLRLDNPPGEPSQCSPMTGPVGHGEPIDMRGVPAKDWRAWLAALLTLHYHPGKDDAALRAVANPHVVPAAFDALRRDYKLRNEVWGRNVYVETRSPAIDRVLNMFTLKPDTT